MKRLEYKGIIFDYVREDEYGIWSSMCKSCQDKYSDRISKDYELQADGGGICGVEGCLNSDWENDIDVNYIDFDIKDVVYITEIEENVQIIERRLGNG